MRGSRVLVLGLIAAGAVVAAATAGLAAQGSQVFDGKQQFDIYCATCHGVGGKGDGTMAGSLRKRPADLTLLSRKNTGEFPTEKIAKFIDGRTRDEAHSKSDMPLWGDVFLKSQSNAGPDDVKNRIEALVKYLETIQVKP